MYSVLLEAPAKPVGTPQSGQIRKNLTQSRKGAKVKRRLGIAAKRRKKLKKN